MNRQRRGNLHLPNEDVESDMFDYILQELEKTALSTTKSPTSPSPALKVVITSCTGTTRVLWSRSWSLRLHRRHALSQPRSHSALPQIHPRKGHSRLHEEFLSQTEQMEEEMF